MSNVAIADLKDVSFEEDIKHDPYSLKNWWYYLEFKASAPVAVRNQIYERGLRCLPRSYKLWWKYLAERRARVRELPLNHSEWEAVNNCFERALVHLHKMPLIWREYLEHLTLQQHITFTRRTFDRALQTVPITQHSKWIWPLYIKFARECGLAETAIRIYRRYLKLNPLEVEDYIDFLKASGRLDEAANQLAKCVNDEQFVSQKAKSKHEMWTELLQIVTKNPAKCGKTLNVDAIIRSGIRRFPHEVGQLWVSLADYYIRLGHFEKARDIYEEGVNSVNTVRDFTLIYDAYSQFEESMLAAKMEATEALEGEANDEEAEDGEDVDVELRLLRLDNLVKRRPLLVSSVLLRQNPHNVREWQKRVDLFKKDPVKAIKTFSEAVTTIDPQLATGKPHHLWINFAKFYEDHGDIANARTIFEQATKVNFKNVDDLASIWSDWVEMELRHDNYKEALDVIKRALVVPAREVRLFQKGGADNVAVQQRLYKSTKLWALYADLEENLGTLESAKAVYEQIIEVRVATPQIIINYAKLMEENKFFEDSYRVFEKGISLFKFPHVYVIWVAYLQRFIERYKGTKVERTRDLFEQAVKDAPPAEGKKLYLLYAKFEEDFGFARRAMEIYDRATKACAVEDRAELFAIYIARCSELFGVTKTRPIYEKAMQELPERALKPVAMRYAALERSLGEIDRARALYTYAAQFCDPRVDKDYYMTWHDFEVHHGNEETFKEMRRVRRTVQTQFAALMNTITPPTAAPTAGAAGTAPTTAANASASSGAGLATSTKAGLGAMAVLEQAAAQKAAEKKAAERAAAEKEAQALALAAASSNPEEIDLDMDDNAFDVETKMVPDSVFGLPASS